MTAEEWDAMDAEQRLKARALHARATASVYETLFSSFPVKLDTSFKDVALSLSSEHPSGSAEIAIDAALELMLDEGLVRLNRNKQGKHLYHGAVLTPDGYSFFCNLNAFQKAPKFIPTALNVNSGEHELVQAYNQFIMLMRVRNEDGVWLIESGAQRSR